MSVILRGSLFIIFLLTFLCILYSRKLRKRDASSVCSFYLMYLAILFPFIEMGISLLGMNLFLYTSLFLFLLYPKIVLDKLFLKEYRLILILFIVYMLSSLFSEFKWLSVLNSIERLLYFIPLFAVIRLQEDGKRQFDYIKFFNIIAFWILLFGFIQLFIDKGFTLRYSMWTAEANRISSCFMDPQTAGTAMAMLFLCYFSFYLKTKNKLYICISLLLLVLSFNTGSKSSLFAIIVGSLFFLLKEGVNVKSMFVFILLFIVLFIFYDDIMHLPVFVRLQDFDSSFEGRQKIFWMGAIDIFYNNDLTGIGVGVFRDYVERYNLPFIHGGEDDFIYASQPESGWLLWLDELGIYSIIYIYIFVYLLLRKQKDLYITNAPVLAFIICNISYYPFVSSGLITLIFMTICGLIILKKNENNSVYLYPRTRWG